MSEWQSVVTIVLLSLGFWLNVPRLLPDRWQGPAEVWMVDIGEWALARYRRLLRREM